MAPRLPTTAAPGAATTTTVVRDRDPRQSAWYTAPSTRETKRLRGSSQHQVFVGLSQRPQQDESLMGPEISWCEVHCQGHWTVVYGRDRPGHGRETYFGFDDPADARAFETWRADRHEGHAQREDVD
jgi:hypothetical protein